jgi:hypothetical protein
MRVRDVDKMVFSSTPHQSHDAFPDTAMSDLHAKKFLIVLAGHSAPPPFAVGANEDEGPVNPVIAGGKDNVWSVRRVESGNYNLVLDQRGPSWLSKGVGDSVVVEIMPLPGEWVITRQEDGTYTIEAPGPIRPSLSWALDSGELGAPVKLRRRDFPARWNFRPVLEE